MVLHDKEFGIARKFLSPDQSDRDRAVGAFVRLFTFSAPTELALLAARHGDACSSYCGDRPLAEHLLRTLSIPDELSLAWRITLLEGEALSSALTALDERYGDSIRKGLANHRSSPDDVYQHLMVRIMTRPRLRRTLFGRYSGVGRLVSYLRTAFVRQGLRELRPGRGPKTHEDAALPAAMRQTTEDSPVLASARAELTAALRDVLRVLAGDAGLLPFLLQQLLEMSVNGVGRILGVDEHVVRQRTFRFRIRFRQAWRRLYPEDSNPFKPDDGP
jgi:DNA-directed RNA polymerase specialized sigma24 family protein